MEQGAYVDQTCPTCGRVNPGTRRFCSRCGYGFVSFEAPDPYATTGIVGGGERSGPGPGRAAGVPAVAAAPLPVAPGDHRGPGPRAGDGRRSWPCGAIRSGSCKDGWYSLQGQYLKVAPVQAEVEPAEATAAKSDPAALVDGSVVEWTMNWAPSQESACGPAAGTGVIVLNFPSTRIRQLQIYPGLDSGTRNGTCSRCPRTLGLSFDTDPCQPITLTNTARPTR